jgi:hypothetical protein
VPDGAIADRNFHTQIVAMVTAITPTNTNSLECTKLLFLEDFAEQALQVQAGIYGAVALQRQQHTQ